MRYLKKFESFSINPVFDEMYKFMDKIYKEGITDYDEMCEEGFKKWDRNDPQLKDMVWDAAATYLGDLKYMGPREIR